MPDLPAEFLELVRLAATDLPPDVEAGLRAAVERESPGSDVCVVGEPGSLIGASSAQETYQ